MKDWPKRPAELPQMQMMTSVALPDGNGGFTPCPELMTEEELIAFLRISKISNSSDYHNVIEHLKKFRGLPRIHVCRRALYPKKAILEWIESEINTEK